MRSPILFNSVCVREYKNEYKAENFSRPTNDRLMPSLSVEPHLSNAFISSSYSVSINYGSKFDLIRVRIHLFELSILHSKTRLN